MQAEAELFKFVPNSSFIGDNLSVKRMGVLLGKLGNPHKSYKIIHIAGTSGKTSTCYYISNMLSSSGKRNGMTISPHIDSITERVQINGSPLSDDKFCAYLVEFLNQLNLDSEAKRTYSYFEIMIAFSLWVFALEKVEYAVVETGIGGLFDSTNVAAERNKVCAITDIGFDHMNILGNTLGEISSQKAGIIHAGNQVFVYKQTEEIMLPISNRAREVGATVEEVNESELAIVSNNKLTDLPLFGRRNYLLATCVCQYLAGRDKFKLVGSSGVGLVVPGRMELCKTPTGASILMDGAHNPQKMEAFVASVEDKYPDQMAVVLLALKTSNDYKEILDALKPITETLIFTKGSSNFIANYCEEIGITWIGCKNLEVAYAELFRSKNELKIATGSFYMLGRLRKLINS